MTERLRPSTVRWPLDIALRTSLAALLATDFTSSGASASEAQKPLALEPRTTLPPSALRNLPRVFARAARLRIVGFFECAAFAIFFAGIFWPSGTPSARCSAPLFFVAPAIQFAPPLAKPGRRLLVAPTSRCHCAYGRLRRVIALPPSSVISDVIRGVSWRTKPPSAKALRR